MITEYVRFACRGYPAAEMASRNEVLLAREIGVETDTSLFKFGDGVTAWNDLDYAGADLSSVLAAIASGDASLATRISSETSSRASADSSLSSSVSSEVSVRASADTSLATSITGEASSRLSADTLEASSRTSADTSLSTRASTDSSIRASADTSLTTRLSAEEVGRSTAVSAEASSRTSADLSLTTAGSVEASTRAAADTSLTTRISAEEATRASAVSTEASSRTAADTSLTTRLSSEESVRASAATSLTTADTSLSTRASIEASTRASADASLATAIAAAGGVSSFNGRSGAVTLTAADIIAALGYTPANVAGHLGQFAATTSAQLAGVISDETGTGKLVFATDATLTGTTNANRVLLNAGSAAAPALAFAGATDTGLYNAGGTQIAFACGGADILGLFSVGAFMASGKRLYFDGGGQTYIVQNSAGTLDIVANAGALVRFSNSLVTINTPIWLEDQPTIAARAGGTKLYGTGGSLYTTGGSGTVTAVSPA